MALVVGLGTGARLGIEKLLVVPLLLPILDAEQMGQFVWLLAWAITLGQFAAGGVSDSLLRLHHEAKESESWPTLLGTGTFLTVLACIGTLLIGGLIYLFVEQRVGTSEKVFMIAGLGIYLILLAARTVLNSAFRIELQFGRSSLVDIVSGAALLLAVPLSYFLGLKGLPLGYALSAVCAIAFQLWLLRKRFTNARIFDPLWSKRVLVTAPVFALSAGSGIAFYQAGRIVLGCLRPSDEVLVFFAAEAVIALALFPVSAFAGIVYSLVARKSSSSDIPRAAILQHIISCILAGVAVYVGLIFLGKFVLTFFYRSLSESAWPLLKILAIGGAVKSLYFFSRGFIYKFCSFRRIIAYSWIGTATVLTLLLLLIPFFKLSGAAWAVTIANCFVALLWFGTYVYLFLIKPYISSRKTPTLGN